MLFPKVSRLLKITKMYWILTWSLHFIYALLLLLLSRFSRVRICATPEGSPPVSPSLGFSRQEHWSGLPFPSPTPESEKWKWSRSVVSESLRPHGLQPTRLLCPWNSQGKSTGVGCHCLLRPTETNDLYIRSDQLLSRVRLFATPWIAAHQASLSITNSRSSLRHVHRVSDAI